MNIQRVVIGSISVQHLCCTQGPEGYPSGSGRKSLGNALRTRGGITRPGRGEVEPDEPPMTHVETAPAPTLDRTITEPLPAVQEEDLGEGHRLSPLMTPKASEANRQDEAFPQAAVYEAEAHLTDEVEAHQKEGGEDDAEGTTAPEELADEQG